jgi:DNA polymerase-3 subunit alpha
MGIEVLPPDVNESGHDFVVAGGNIRFGLDAVKNVGSAAVDAVMAARAAGGPFTSIYDFCARVDCRAVNKKAIESLVRCGALDSTGASRRGMLEVLPAAQAAGSKSQQDALLGQSSIFDLEDPVPGPASATAATFRAHPPVPPLSDDPAVTRAMEKETLGLFLSSHPLKEVRPALRARVECSLSALADRRDGDWVTVGGMITESKKIRTRAGDWMLFATLDDLEGQVEMLALGGAYERFAEVVDGDRVVVVRGRVDHKGEGETKLVAQDVEVFAPSPEEVERARLEAQAPPPVRRIMVEVSPSVPDSFLEELREVVRSFPGEHELALAVGERRLLLGDGYRVSACTACRGELAALPGVGALTA